MFGKVSACRSTHEERVCECTGTFTRAVVEITDGPYTDDTTAIGDGQNTDPQSMDYPSGLPKWTTLKWTAPKNNIPNEYHAKL